MSDKDYLQGRQKGEEGETKKVKLVSIRTVVWNLFKMKRRFLSCVSVIVYFLRKFKDDSKT